VDSLGDPLEINHEYEEGCTRTSAECSSRSRSRSRSPKKPIHEIHHLEVYLPGQSYKNTSISEEKRPKHWEVLVAEC
jgi:hypothetical protein